MTRYLGVDLHKNMFMVCFFETENNYFFKNYRLEQVEIFKKELKSTDVVGVEATTNTKYFVKQIEDKGVRIKVLNPLQFKVITKSTKKTDKNDAYTISYFLSRELVPEVRMKKTKYSEIESLANTRDKLVKLRTALKNKIHNILSSQGIITKKECMSSEKGLQAILKYEVSKVAKFELDVIVEQIRCLNTSIGKLDKELENSGKGLDGFENITSIKGIGGKSGSILLSVIGDVNDFKNEKKLASYFGIVPRVEISNETVRYGRITKKGCKLGRTTLVQCTLVAIKYSSYLRNFYDKINHKKGNSGKAIIATAKKLLGIIYHTLKNRWIFEDFGEFLLKS